MTVKLSLWDSIEVHVLTKGQRQELVAACSGETNSGTRNTGYAVPCASEIVKYGCYRYDVSYRPR